MVQVPELAGFWLMTLFQLILTTYLLVNVNSIILPIEIVAGVPLFGFLAFEVLVGFRALQVRTCLGGLYFCCSLHVPVSLHSALLLVLLLCVHVQR